MAISRAAWEACIGLLLLSLAGCNRPSAAASLDMPISVESQTLEGTSSWGDSRVKLPLPFAVWDKTPVKIVRIAHGCGCLSVDSKFDGVELRPGSSQTVDV